MFNNIDLNNMYLFCGVLGFILALGNTIYLIFSRRSNISIEFKKMEITFIDENTPGYLLLCIQNKSSSPLTISRIFLFIGDKKFEFEWLPQSIYKISEGTKNETLYSHELYSKVLPINIQGLDMVGGHFCVFTDNEITDKYIRDNSIFLHLNTPKGIKKFILDNSVFKKFSLVYRAKLYYRKCFQNRNKAYNRK